MKATLHNPETTAATATDPIPRMRELLTAIPIAKEEAKALDAKGANLDHRIRTVVFNALDKNINCSMPLDKVVSLYKSRGVDDVASEFCAVKKLWKKSSDLYDGIERDEAELAELVRKFGSARDQELLKLHGAIVARIEKDIRPHCDSDKEANAEARGFNRPTYVHTRIGGWTRYPDVLVKARTLIQELETPLPELVSTK